MSEQEAAKTVLTFLNLLKMNYKHFPRDFDEATLDSMISAQESLVEPIKEKSMTAWPRDTTAEKNSFYGDFNAKGWQETNLVHMMAPFDMYYEKQLLRHGILVHKKIVPALTAAFAEIWERCGHVQSQVDKTGASDFDGCFNIRRIAGSNNWSNHSWAIAIDLSPSTNGFNTGHGSIGTIVIDAFKRQGARWGGDYHGRTDPMHFEFVSPA